ncbi:MAG: hypothetical protein EOQ94_09680 [Mesorhizobium sp.]|uniref:hypothetical protein n=1 Tax=Mesorhizobium sp. TaxID=1871066 RepID=UPI000FEA996E|nr:hypothetical protein [Mesorhizobium sp.]RWI25848.1 MAG: hypothetical protein EOQ94_09680 [Mesorhizobium sp.]
MSGAPTMERRADTVSAAALWLATGNRDKNRAAAPQLCEPFGLTTRQACEAIAEANLIRARTT